MRRPTAIALGLAVVLGAVITGSVFAEFAAVTVFLPPRVVYTEVSLTGSSDNGSIFRTTRRSFELTDTLEAPTSLSSVGTLARGEVIFHWFDTCTREPCGARYTVPKGYILLTDRGVAYKTLVERSWGNGQWSQPTPVVAVVAGPAGNAKPHSITHTKLFPGYVIVDNPRPISGGASRMAHVVLKADYDAAVKKLQARLLNEVDTMLRITERDMTYIRDGNPKFEVHTDHAIGEEVPSFHLTMTASMSLVGYSEQRVRVLMTRALRTKTYPDTLFDDQIRVSYQVDDFDPNGDIALHGTVVGYAFSRLDEVSLEHHLARLPLGVARDEIAHAYPGALVRITTFPGGMPMLPVASDHIVIHVAGRSLP